MASAVSGNAAKAHQISRLPLLLPFDLLRWTKLNPLAVTEATAAPGATLFSL